MNLLKKFTLSFLSALILLFSFAPYSSIKAQSNSTWYSQGPLEWLRKVYDPSNPSEIFGERYTAAQVQWILYSIPTAFVSITPSGRLSLCLFASQSLTEVASCIPIIEEVKKMLEDLIKTSKSQGYLNNSNKNLAQLVFDTSRPFSGISYTKNRIENLKLIPVAQAQSAGFGYTTALKPIQNFWAATRNVSYSFFVLITVIFAFLIMFRIKLNPQTVITVQSAIPKIILSLVAATFSYAIAGFVVDLMYVVIGILSIVLAGISPETATKIVSGVTSPPAAYFALMTTGIFGTGIWGFMSIGLLIFLIPLAIFFSIGSLSGLLSGGIGTIVTVVILSLVSVIIIWIAIKIIWTLVKTFAIFILTVIFSPLTLVLGTFIPTFSLGSWIKTLFSHLAVFITTGVLISLVIVFGLQGFSILSQTTGMEWLKGLIEILMPGARTAIRLIEGSSGWPPLLNFSGNTAEALIMWGVSFVLFTMIPKSAELIQSFIQGKPFAYGSAIGEALAPATWAGRKAWNDYGAPVNEAINLASIAKNIDSMAPEGGRLNAFLNNLSNGTWRAKSKDIRERGNIR